jgi:phage gp29-like protein
MPILDHLGRPIETAKISEPQTAGIAALQHQWHDINIAAGLSPARLAQLFASAAAGNLADQAELFEDMLERDAHLYAEMDKRKSAPGTLDWAIVPPRNASAEEKKLAAYADELIRDLPDFEDLVKALMDGVGHGFSALEITWHKEGGELLPSFEHKPQEYFQLSIDRKVLHLRDGSAEGADLWPAGWILHTHGLAKTGYLGKMPLYRVLAWPFLYKVYGLGDFAEFLETYGLPIIKGKYPSGATTDQQRSLLRAVQSLGHDARAIMPADMEIEIINSAMGANTGHLDMVAWADKAQSKCILGGTLTSQADGKTSTNALGNVHQDVRTDIRNSDCRQIAGTLTRDLVYVLLLLNKGGITSLRRCPRLVFDTGEAEDLALYADSLPKLVGINMRIPARYAHDKLKIPEPEGDEAILSMATSAPIASPAAPVAAATISPTVSRIVAPVFTQQQQAVENLSDQLLAQLGSPVNADLIRSAINAASDPEDLEQRLAALMSGSSQDEFAQALSYGLFAADILGYVHGIEG